MTTTNKNPRLAYIEALKAMPLAARHRVADDLGVLAKALGIKFSEVEYLFRPAGTRGKASEFKYMARTLLGDRTWPDLTLQQLADLTSKGAQHLRCSLAAKPEGHWIRLRGETNGLQMLVSRVRISKASDTPDTDASAPRRARKVPSRMSQEATAQ